MVSVNTSADHICTTSIYEEINAEKDENTIANGVIDGNYLGNLVGDVAVGDELVMAEVVNCDAVAMCGKTNCAEAVVDEIRCRDGDHVINADGDNVHGDNLNDRDLSFDNILLDDGELVDVQVDVTKQDIVTNVTNNKCNTEKSNPRCNRC